MIIVQSSILKVTYVLIGISFAILLSGCKQATEPINKSSYPSVLKFSDERYASFMNTWNQFNQKYQLHGETPRIDSVLMVPEWFYLSNLYGFQIDLFPDRDGLISLDDARTRLKAFIDEWGLLFNCSSTELKEIDARKEQTFSGSMYFFRFEQNYNYELNTVGWTGEIIADIDSTGKLIGISSNCLPILPVPVHAEITIEKAKQSLIGKKLRYSDWTGLKELVLTNENLKKDTLVIAFISRYDKSSRLESIEYRLCWKYETSIFYVYADAVTGEDVNYYEQSVIF
jgi:hypothetical protein